MPVRISNVFLFLALAAAPAARAQATQEHQHQHHQNPPAATPAAAAAAHHAFLAEERAAIERGEGFGMAMAADHNGYPGPKHILEMKSELKLSPEQEAAVERLFSDMREKALTLGKQVLDAEARLDQMFAENRPPNELREQVDRVAALRAQLRWAHLSAHLAARKVLTADQIAAYTHLRHGGL